MPATAAAAAAAMGDIISPCKNFWDMSIEQSPQVCLRVTHAPIGRSSGAMLTGYGVGQELLVMELLKDIRLAPLTWRFERNVQDREGAPRRQPGVSPKPPLPWPNTYRYRTPRKSWRVPVLASDGCGGWQAMPHVMQVAMVGEARTVDFCLADIQDAGVAATYAERFNSHLRRTVANEAGLPEDSREVVAPRVQVAAPVACEVVNSSHPQLFRVHDIVILHPYVDEEVKKFVFEGDEEFLELPQAFFHHAAWSAGGKEWVSDIQGTEMEDGSILIIDPVMLRSSAPTVADVLTSMEPSSMMHTGAEPEEGPSAHRFERCHPRCSQMCKVFDPQRRGGAAKTACGVNVSTCGF